MANLSREQSSDAGSQVVKQQGRHQHPEAGRGDEGVLLPSPPSSPLLPPSTFTTVMLPRPTPDSPPPHFSGHAAPAAATPIGSPPCNKHPGQRHVPGWLVPRELADAASCLPCVLLTQQCHPQERALRKQCRVHHDEHTRTLAAELFTY